MRCWSPHKSQLPTQMLGHTRHLSNQSRRLQSRRQVAWCRFGLCCLLGLAVFRFFFFSAGAFFFLHSREESLQRLYNVLWQKKAVSVTYLFQLLGPCKFSSVMFQRKTFILAPRVLQIVQVCNDQTDVKLFVALIWKLNHWPIELFLKFPKNQITKEMSQPFKSWQCVPMHTGCSV